MNKFCSRLLEETAMGIPCSLMDLPEPVIHQIMSYLPAKEATRMAVLSSRFASMYYSFPFIELRYDHFADNPKTTFNQFLNYVNYTYLARRAPNVALEKFVFHVCVSADLLSTSDYDDTNKAIHYALDNNVKDLDLRFINADERIGLGYIPPPKLLSAKSLKALSLFGCSFAEDFVILDSPLMEQLTIIEDCTLKVLNVLCDKLANLELGQCPKLNLIEITSPNLVRVSLQQSELVSCQINISECKLLQYMSLKNVTISDEWIHSLVSRCSQLASLDFDCCYFSGNLSLHHDRLKTLKVWNCKHLAKIEVVALNLESFEYTEKKDQLCEIDIVGSRFLKTLTLVEAKTLTDEWLPTQVSGLYFLESLSLSRCNVVTKVEITNHNLKKLELINCVELKEIEITARNLHSLKYEGEVCKLESVVLDSICLNAELLLLHVSYEFSKLAHFLSFFGHCQQLKLVQYEGRLMVPGSLKENSISPMYDLKKLVVDISSSSLKNIKNLVDSLLWLAPHPEVLSIHSGSSQKTIELQYEKPLVANKDDNFCCSLMLIKCWRHYLAKVTLENFTSREQEILHEYFSAETYRYKRPIRILYKQSTRHNEDWCGLLFG